MINFVASANTTSTPAATMVVTLPSHSEGDVIILSFVHNYNSAVQALTAVSEGYTELASLAISGLGHQASIWYKKAGASEVNPTATYSASSQIMACTAASYTGVDDTVQIDVGPSLWTTEDPGDTTVIAPSVTTTLDGAMLVTIATADDNDVFTQPSGMTLVDNLEFNSMTTASAYELIATAGATGDKTWTFAQNTDEITAVSFALRPAVGGSGISISVDSTLPSLSSSLSLSKVDNSFSIDINSILPSLSSSLSLTSTDGVFDLSISSELPSLTSILNLSVVNPGNNASINSFLPSLVSSLSLTKEDPATGVSINSELPSLISSLSLSVTNPEFDFSVVSTLPSLSSSLSLYNGVLGISIGDRNNINIVVKSTNINITTKSRNIEEY